jgi:CYTH domain-containing protein
MPIETEWKYVLDDPDGSLEAAVTATCPVFDIEQAYLDDGARVRRIQKRAPDATARFVYTHKRKIAGVTVEIECKIDQRDYTLLRGTCRRSLRKIRVVMIDGEQPFEIDFFKLGDRTYFVLAEAEVAETVQRAPALPPLLAPRLLQVVAPDARGYSSRDLCDVRVARAILDELRASQRSLGAAATA